jgi:hypothetical protein
MSKPVWMTVGSLEMHEKTNSFKLLMKNFLYFCKDKTYKKGSLVNYEEFRHLYHIGPIQLKTLIGILELRKYTQNNTLIHSINVIQDNFEFRSNRVAYLMKNQLT